MPTLMATAWIRPVFRPGCPCLGRCAKRGVGTSSPVSSEPNRAMTAPEAPTLTVISGAGLNALARNSAQNTLAQLASRPPAK